MPITPIADTAQSVAASTRLSDNYDTFLVLLTAQLQNQDPLAPMDSTQFTQQLVQFSQVEQQIRTNEQLEGLVAQYQAASAGAALAYLGRDALIESNITTLGETGDTRWGYALEEAAALVNLEVRDSQNRVVFRAEGVRSSGDHLFAWDGTTIGGGRAPPGRYRMIVDARDENNEAMGATVTVREAILGVDFTGAAPLVLTGSGSRGLETIRAVLDAG